MAISKIIFKESANATPVTWMDATPATAAAADITAPKTAMLADGVVTTGTGSGGGGGSGLTTIASGTFTGAGSYQLYFSVGNKMPQTNFWVKIKAHANTEFAYDTNYKPATGVAVLFSDFAHFDLSTVGDSKQPVSDISYAVNNSGSISNVSLVGPVLELMTIRNSSNGAAVANNVRISRKTTGFEVGLFLSNASYAYPTGITYDFEVVYFGSNPATEIVTI